MQNLFSNILHPSLSVSVCSCLFSALLLCSFLLFCPSPSPSYCIRVRIMFPSIRLILSAFHIRIRPVSVSSDLAFMLFLLLFGYNPYQPNPIAPRFLIVFCPLLSYDPFILIVPICINYDKLQQLASACKPTQSNPIVLSFRIPFRLSSLSKSF